MERPHDLWDDWSVHRRRGWERGAAARPGRVRFVGSSVTLRALRPARAPRARVGCVSGRPRGRGRSPESTYTEAKAAMAAVSEPRSKVRMCTPTGGSKRDSPCLTSLVHCWAQATHQSLGAGTGSYIPLQAAKARATGSWENGLMQCGGVERVGNKAQAGGALWAPSSLCARRAPLQAPRACSSCDQQPSARCGAARRRRAADDSAHESRT